MVIATAAEEETEVCVAPAASTCHLQAVPSDPFSSHSPSLRPAPPEKSRGCHAKTQGLLLVGACVCFKIWSSVCRCAFRPCNMWDIAGGCLEPPGISSRHGATRNNPRPIFYRPAILQLYNLLIFRRRVVAPRILCTRVHARSCPVLTLLRSPSGSIAFSGSRAGAPPCV